jgi:hypothetical protein
MDPAIKNANKE